MQMVFDRYAPRGGPRHLDLATGRIVVIAVRDVPDEDWRRRWRLRVDALLSAVDGLEPLLDAGEAGAHRVFEVRALPHQVFGRPIDLARADAASAIEWLDAASLSTGPCRAARILSNGRLCADVHTAWPIETGAEIAAARRTMRAWGRLLQMPAAEKSREGGPHVSGGAAGVRDRSEDREACDGRAGLVPLDLPVPDALRFARETGRVAIGGGNPPDELEPAFRARRSFLLVEPAAQSAAAWAAALAAEGSRRHFFVPPPSRVLVARERAAAYTSALPESTSSPLALRAQALLAQARNHFARHELAQTVRIAGRAAQLAEGRARAEAVMLKARALRCDGQPREASAVLACEHRHATATITAPFLIECAEAACDNALLEHAEAFARASLLAAGDAAAQHRARLALDRARVWRGESVDTDFWRARAAWHVRGLTPVWPARGGYAHAPCGALAGWEHACDLLERALWHGRDADAARLKKRFDSVRGQLPLLLRSRVEWLASGEQAVARRMGARGVLQTGKAGAVMEIFEHMSALLTTCHESASDEAALNAAAAATRRAVRARSVALHAAGRPLPVAGDGDKWNVSSAVAMRCSQAVQTTGPEQADHGTQIATTIRGADAPVGALVATWPAGTPFDAGRARLLLEAAALVIAPVLRGWLARADAPAAADMPEIVGVSPAIGSVRDSIRRVAQVPFAVVIEGESGAGKELVARAIHRLSPRAARPFRAINCAAMSEELVEAELFGHAQGAYTGAVSARAGLFEDADRGTLFLDEVSELSPRAQAKLLRVLQEGEVRRVGETAPRRVDVRIVAASNRSLAAAAAANAFRADLLFRLDVLRITVPPLRARTEDIPVLCAHFWREAAGRAGTSALLSPDALGRLAAYPWPGNVRELQNVIAAMAVSCPRRGRAGVEHLPAHIRCDAAPPPTLHQAKAMLERDLVRSALARAGGKPGRAAAELGLSRQGFAKLMRRLGLPAA